MFRFFRRLFRKKQPKKIIEVREELQDKNRRRHDFSSFKDSEYCTILDRMQGSSEDSIMRVKIAWRSPNRIKEGDLIILSGTQEFRTLRLTQILKDESDVKIGIACCFK